MSRWIDADVIRAKLMEYIGLTNGFDRAFSEVPSIDIVHCFECKHGEYREDYDEYECHSSGCGLVYDADFYCADGERSRR